MSGFQLHPEYTSTQIHHLSLYYIVQRQENLPQTHSISDSTVASKLSLGPDLFPDSRDVLTTSLALGSLCNIYISPKRCGQIYFPLDKFLHNAYTTFKTIPLRSVKPSARHPTIFQLDINSHPRTHKTPFSLYSNIYMGYSFFRLPTEVLPANVNYNLISSKFINKR
jgi:hypothetical protein